jgi:glucose-1-phosphate cytidylyltransferase
MAGNGGPDEALVRKLEINPMKVVLFCGGQGMRMREYSETIPKPMVPVGPRPILWHLMKYYSYFGHSEFILCLGHKGPAIKEYFLHYDECISNDFILSCGSRQISLANQDLENWTITFVDTGQTANIGQRLKAVQPYLRDDAVFLANYSDNLSDLPLPEMIDWFERQEAVGAFVSVRPGQSFHLVSTEGEHRVIGLQPVSESNIWINGGYFVFRRSVFDYMLKGEELVEEPFGRIIAENRLVTWKHRGFWMCMDTFKDRQVLEDRCTRGDAPWEVWRSAGGDKQARFCSAGGDTDGCNGGGGQRCCV